MKITRPQTKTLIQALYEAIESQESLVDAHRIAWDKRRRRGMLEKCIPEEYRKDVNTWQRQISKYKKLLMLLRLDLANKSQSKLGHGVGCNTEVCPSPDGPCPCDDKT